MNGSREDEMNRKVIGDLIYQEIKNIATKDNLTITHGGGTLSSASFTRIFGNGSRAVAVSTSLAQYIRSTRDGFNAGTTAMMAFYGL